MTLTVTAHLNFRRQARSALAFYHSVFGGEQTLVTYETMGKAGIAHAPDDIMWGQVASPDGFRIMAFDVQAGRTYEAGANAFFLSLRGTSPNEVQARWSALAEDGTVLHPLEPSSWSALYGMLTDRFGITWIVDVGP